MSGRPAGASTPGSLAPLRIGIVAGEASGDQLGAALIAALTLKRVKAGNMAGIRNTADMKTLL